MSDLVPAASELANISAAASNSGRGAEPWWPRGWWKLMETRIGIVPLPVYILLVALITGFAATGKVPSEISVSIAILAVGGFTCGEIGKRLPVVAQYRRGGHLRDLCTLPTSRLTT